MKKAFTGAIFETHLDGAEMVDIVNLHLGQPIKGIHPVAAAGVAISFTATAAWRSVFYPYTTSCTSHAVIYVLGRWVLFQEQTGYVRVVLSQAFCQAGFLLLLVGRPVFNNMINLDTGVQKQKLWVRIALHVKHTIVQ